VKFEDLANIKMCDVDTNVQYLCAYNSSYTMSSKPCTLNPMAIDDFWSQYVFEKAHKNGSNYSLGQNGRLVITTKMKTENLNEHGYTFLNGHYVTCFYPIVADSPYYSNEELFEAKLTDNFVPLIKKLRKAFYHWKKVN